MILANGSRRAIIIVASALALGTVGARAQQADSARIGIAPAPINPSAEDSAAAHRDSVLLAGPPVRPKTALLRSLAIPGWGQASLDRGTAGATYFALEAGSIAMLLFAKQELAVAKRAARVRLRRLQVEDWAALIFFTHLFSAADAFVSAHLWDVRVQVHGEARLRTAGVSASIPW
jgi:hypothetical protein